MTGVGQCCPLVHGPHCPASAVTQTTTQQGPTQGQGAQTVHLALQHAVHKFASITIHLINVFLKASENFALRFKLTIMRLLRVMN